MGISDYIPSHEIAGSILFSLRPFHQRILLQMAKARHCLVVQREMEPMTKLPLLCLARKSSCGLL